VDPAETLRSLLTRARHLLGIPIGFMLICSGICGPITFPYADDVYMTLLRGPQLGVDEVEDGDRVFAQGQLLAPAEVVPESGLVFAELQYEDGPGWVGRDRKTLPMTLMVGALQVHLEDVDPPAEGQVATFELGEGKRWHGYAADVTLSIVGEVVNLDPLTIDVEKHYGGTRDEAIETYATLLFAAKVIGGIFVLGGLMTMLGSVLRAVFRPR